MTGACQCADDLKRVSGYMHSADMVAGVSPLKGTLWAEGCFDCWSWQRQTSPFGFTLEQVWEEISLAGVRAGMPYLWQSGLNTSPCGELRAERGACRLHDAVCQFKLTEDFWKTLRPCGGTSQWPPVHPDLWVHSHTCRQEWQASSFKCGPSGNN